MKREFLDYVDDIVESMEKAMEFVENMEYDDFIKDAKTIYALVRALEVIGKAAKRIPVRIKDRYPKIPWKDMAGMRDKLIHEYFGVNLEVVWGAVKKEIPVLKPLFAKILEDFKD